ncbi:MAG TPA: hypothetical protein VIF83_08930 [Gemmatimonadaceae bacterium]|jgi:hypothetical protein
MTDTYLLLTPLLMLAVVALVGFVGCDSLFGLDHVDPVPPAPTNLTALAGDNRVDLSWDAYAGASVMRVKRGESHGNYMMLDPPLAGTTTSFVDMTAQNGITYFYVVVAYVGSNVSNNSNEVVVTPGVEAFITFVTSESLGTLGNFGGWVGMGIQIGARALTVRTLGRYICPNNTGDHRIKIVDGATKADIPGAVVTAVSPDPMGKYKYGTLASSVVLNPGAEYYIISEETATGDQFYGSVDTSVGTSGDASRVFAVNGDGMGQYATGSIPNFVYGPMNFQYNII